MAITESLISDFQKAQKAPESQRKDAVKDLCTDIVEGMKGGHFSALKDVDFDKLLTESVPKTALDNLRSGSPHLVEAALDVMASTQFPDLLGTTVQVGMWEGCAQAPLTIMSEIDQVNVGCGQTVTYGYHPLGDIVDDECLAERKRLPIRASVRPTS